MAANEWVKYAVVTGKNELAEGECGYGLSIFNSHSEAEEYYLPGDDERVVKVRIEEI